MLKKFRIFSALLSASMLGLCGISGYYAEKIPDSFYVEKGETLDIASYPSVSVSFSGTAPAELLTYPSLQEASLKLFGVIPIKSVEICRTEAPVLTAGGTPFGIKLLMDGVMVVKLNETDCPAKDCGIETGDIIRFIDNIPVSSNSDIQRIISGSGGKTLNVSASRSGKDYTTSLTPVWNSEKKCYIGGMWVRDSTAGIGTLTFIDKSTGMFAGLGHPICDSDTGEIVPVSSGKAVPVEITGAVKGRSGVPGELDGCFVSGDCIGELELNNRCGIFGHISQDTAELCQGRDYKMGFKQDIEKGKAEILCTTEGNIPKSYEIEIESIDYSGENSTRNMIIKITDKRLIEKTGGIVQGMSGSPIIQNDKIIGAVTHVFISDSTRGYGIFAENMSEYTKQGVTE